MNRKIVLLSVAVLVAALAVGGSFLGRSLLNNEPNTPDPIADQTAPLQPLPTITVEANYPGASALVVAETAAAPIEQQVNGVEGMLSMYSRSTNDGAYLLTVTFTPDTDMNIAQVQVQNRVSLAEPVLPDLIRRHGITVRKKSPALLGFVLLTSPDGRFDTLYLSNYVTHQVKDEMFRVAGVADLLLLGLRESSLRIWLDPEKLASRNLTVGDVTNALAEQKVQVAAGVLGPPPVRRGQAFQINVTTVGRLNDPESVGNLVLKSEGGRVVLLRDVASLELDNTAEGSASFNGKPGVALGIALLPQAKPREVLATLQEKLTTLRARLPAGIDLALAFDFAANLEAPDQPNTPEYLRLDLTLPDAAALERTQQVAVRCEEILRSTGGVRDVLSVSGSPFSVAANEAMLLASLTPLKARTVSRHKLIKDLRAQLVKEIQEAQVYLCDVTNSERFPLRGDAVELALEDRDDRGLDELRNRGEELVKRLSARPELTEVHLSASGRTSPLLFIVVDRSQAKDRGVALQDVLNTLSVYTGGLYVNDFNRFGRTWQIVIQADSLFRTDPDRIKQLTVRSTTGDKIPLGAMVSIEARPGPVLVERYNMYRMISLSANPAPGVSLTDARKLCESEFAEASKGFAEPKAFALESMRPIPPSK